MLPKTFSSQTTHTIVVKPVTSKKYITSRCLVHFRPGADWKGEFGFDWIREGNTGLTGDEDYKIISKPFDIIKTEYNRPAHIKWDKVKDGKDFEYYAPWLSLFPEKQTQGAGNLKKCRAKLKCYYEIKDEKPEKIHFYFDAKFFKLSVAEITPNAIGKYEGNSGMDLEITCIEEFDEDQDIYAFVDTREPDGSFKTYIGGKMRVVKNNKDSRFSAKVVFVKVRTDFNVDNQVDAISKTDMDLMQTHFCQLLTTLNFKEESLDLRDDDELVNNYAFFQNKTFKIASNPQGKIKLHDFLDSRFRKKFEGGKYPYDDYYKIFYFKEDGGVFGEDGKYVLAGGEASGIPSPIKCVNIYNRHKESAPTHELFHAMGLYHTFEPTNLNKYKFDFKKTENIMDYSQIRTASFKWQWDKIHPNLVKE
jgi:hypothetical protein